MKLNQNITVSIYVPVDKMDWFIRLTKGEDVTIPIYKEKMHRPICLQINVPLGQYQLIEHLIK